MFEYQARALRVVDADTLRLDIDLGMDIHVGVTVRLLGINAPERNTPEGIAATDYAKGWVLAHTESGDPLTIVTFKDKREKYGRYLVDVYSFDRNHWLNADLVAEGHAVRKDYR